jgi:four helix bundle protein
MAIQKFEDLDCWKQARTLTGLVYELCEHSKLSRDGRLRDQLTGAAISGMNNIAEGFDSQSNTEFRRFLNYARRSVSEVQSCLYVAFDRRFVSDQEFQRAYKQAEATRKVIDGFLRYLRAQRVKRNGPNGQNRLTG